MKKTLISVLTLVLACTMILGCASPAFAAVGSSVTSKVSINVPIVTYAFPKSGASRVYAYSDSSLSTQQSSYYIDALTDQIVITSISSTGKAVLVSYPSSSSSTGYRSKWFKAEDIIGLASENVTSYRYTGSTLTTYRRSGLSTITSYGSISSNDLCYSLGTYKIGSSNYSLVIYPIANSMYNNVSLIGHKMALIPNSNVATVATKMADIANGQVGYAESGTNRTKYGEWYGMNGVEWCAIFVSYCARQAGVSTSALPNISYVNNYFNLSGIRLWNSTNFSKMKKGDVILFANSEDNGTAAKAKKNSQHVGIVYSVSGSNVTVIEGNCGNAVRKNTYTVNSSTGKITSQPSTGCGWGYFCAYVSI